ncbi:hypothetical protein GCM10010531_15240 [Blastococcus jejuensis]|uniref:PIN domain-containing protein n=1 Tax=Blastococcus jejuensis TaxID=351224 RepID=A0ABP6P1V8_9ACTN
MVRRVTGHERPSFVRLDPYSSTPGVPAVLDADALLSSIRHHALNDWPSRIARFSEGGRLPVLASEHVYWEVYKGLPKHAAETGLSIDALRACFETAYLPHIRWVRVASGFGHDERVLLVTDMTDVPTAHLASLIAPCVVLSEDKSLRRPGFAGNQWREVAGSTVAVAETLAHQQGLALGVSLPTVGSFKAATAFSRRIQLPGWVGALALVGGVVWLLRDSRRREVAGQVFTPLLDEFSRLQDEQHRALADLEAVVLEPAQPAGAKQMIATILARADEPVLAVDIHQALADHFPEAEGPPLKLVRQVLTEEPEFLHGQRYRWQLGRRLKALRDSQLTAFLRAHGLA